MGRREEETLSRNLRRSLLLTFAGLMALMLAAGLGALYVARQLHLEEEEVRGGFLARSQSLQVLCSSVHIYSDRVQDYVLGEDQGDGQAAAEFGKRMHEIEAVLAGYPQDRPPEEKALLESLEKLAADQTRIANTVVAWSPEDRRKQALGFLTEQVMPGHAQILEISEQIALWNGRQIDHVEQQLLADFSRSRERLTTLLIATLFLGLLLSAASAIYIFRLERQVRQRYGELAHSRSELEQLSARLVDAQEMERRSISRELHDEVGQSLGALLVDVGRLSALIGRDDTQVKDHVNRIRSVAEETVRNVRDIALLLRPSMLDDLGLVAAIEWQGREVSRRSEMEVEVQSSNVGAALPDELKICIYRLVQEALNNAARHSKARNASVNIEQTASAILVSVTDDGQGFDPKRTRGMGILGMEERLRRLGGKLTIESKAGHGTVLKAELPLRVAASTTDEQDSSPAGRRS